MDSKEYLISYGWKEGEAFREGGLKRPILVKHKRDKKGLGNAPGGNDGEAWWERLFDGHLKNLDVSTDSNNGSIKFTQNEAVATAVIVTKVRLRRRRRRKAIRRVKKERKVSIAAMKVINRSIKNPKSQKNIKRKKVQQEEIERSIYDYHSLICKYVSVKDILKSLNL